MSPRGSVYQATWVTGSEIRPYVGKRQRCGYKGYTGVLPIRAVCLHHWTCGASGQAGQIMNRFRLRSGLFSASDGRALPGKRNQRAARWPGRMLRSQTRGRAWCFGTEHSRQKVSLERVMKTHTKLVSGSRISLCMMFLMGTAGGGTPSSSPEPEMVDTRDCGRPLGPPADRLRSTRADQLVAGPERNPVLMTSCIRRYGPS